MPSPFPFDFSLFFLLPFFLLSFCSSQSHHFPASYAVLFGDGAALLITRTYTPAYTHTSCLLTLKQKYGFYNTKKYTGRFNGVVDCVKQSVQKEGIKGVYKGMAAPLFMTGLVNSALFGMQYNLVGAMVAKREGKYELRTSTDEVAVRYPSPPNIPNI